MLRSTSSPFSSPTYSFRQQQSVWFRQTLIFNVPYQAFHTDGLTRPSSGEPRPHEIVVFHFVLYLLGFSVGAREQVKCYQSNWNGAHPPILKNNGAKIEKYNGKENGNQLNKQDSKVKEQHRIILRTCDPDVTHCLSLNVVLKVTAAPCVTMC